jgi:hypothetical protein
MAKRVSKKEDLKVKVIQKNLLGEDIIDDVIIEEETKAVDLFNFTNSMFKDKKNFEKLSLYDKGKFSFMINRYMASTFPYQACMLSLNKLNPGIITSVWYNNLFKNMTSAPSYFFIKISNKYKKVDTTYKPSLEAVTLFKDKYDLDNKAYAEVYKRYTDDVNDELKNIEKMINAK